MGVLRALGQLYSLGLCTYSKECRTIEPQKVSISKSTCSHNSRTWNRRDNNGVKGIVVCTCEFYQHVPIIFLKIECSNRPKKTHTQEAIGVLQWACTCLRTFFYLAFNTVLSLFAISDVFPSSRAHGRANRSPVASF